MQVIAKTLKKNNTEIKRTENKKKGNKTRESYQLKKKTSQKRPLNANLLCARANSTTTGLTSLPLWPRLTAGDRALETADGGRRIEWTPAAADGHSGPVGWWAKGVRVGNSRGFGAGFFFFGWRNKAGETALNAVFRWSVLGRRTVGWKNIELNKNYPWDFLSICNARYPDSYATRCIKFGLFVFFF